MRRNKKAYSTTFVGTRLQRQQYIDPSASAGRINNVQAT